MRPALHHTGNGLIVEGPARFEPLPQSTAAAAIVIGPHALHELIRDRFGLQGPGPVGRLRVTIESLDE